MSPRIFLSNVRLALGSIRFLWMQAAYDAEWLEAARLALMLGYPSEPALSAHLRKVFEINDAFVGKVRLDLSQPRGYLGKQKPLHKVLREPRPPQFWIGVDIANP